MGDDEVTIHGQLDARLKVPILVELDGRRLRVVRDVPRIDLQLVAWNRDLYRELTLADGTQVVVFPRPGQTRLVPGRRAARGACTRRRVGPGDPPPRTIPSELTPVPHQNPQDDESYGDEP